jgi:hypothetical protein
MGELLFKAARNIFVKNKHQSNSFRPPLNTLGNQIKPQHYGRMSSKPESFSHRQREIQNQGFPEL